MFSAYLKTIIWALIIAILSFISGDRLEAPNFLDIPGLDKWVHAIMYFILTLLFLYETLGYNRRYNRFFLLILIPLGYGFLIEILQMLLTATRSGELFDILANSIGVFLAWFLFLRLGKDRVFKS